MKGLFFINFMIITSCICVVSALLWDYVVRTGHRWLLLLVALLLAVLSAFGLYHYEDLFPGLVASGWDGLYDRKAMAGLIWLLACLLAFPCLVVVAIARFFCRPRHRRRRRQRRASGVTRRAFLKGLAAGSGYQRGRQSLRRTRFRHDVSRLEIQKFARLSRRL